MSRPDSDRNLLFAVLALQIRLVSRDDLLAAMDAWGSARDRPLGEILVERGAMGEQDRAPLEALLDRQVARHGSAEQSLRGLGVSSSVREAVGQGGEPDWREDLASLGQTADPEATGAHLPPDPPPGLRYRVLRPHAKGGLGEVFVARDLELGREVALKEIQPRHAHHEASRGRFVLEAEITGGLEHPGIVPVYGLGAYEDGRPYYAMRFIKGDNLKDASRRFHQQHQANAAAFGTLEFRQLLGRFVDVCQAVAYAHSRGVLHRDLKPGNVMLGKFGETLVVDWGLAKVVGRQDQAADGEATLMPSGSGGAETVEGLALGTPGFMSPEQAGGKVDELGPRTDIYSLGATLYALLTDRPPVEGSDVGQVLGKVRRGDWPAPRAVRPAVPLALDAVCRKAMALNPEGRYASALELAEDIEHWLADEPVRACRDPLRVRAGRWLRKHRTFAASAAVAAVVLMAALGVGLGIVGWFNRQFEAANTDLGQTNARLDEANTELKAANAQLEQARGAAVRERDEADKEKRIAQAVRDFLQKDLLGQADPTVQANRRLRVGGGFAVKENPTVRELLDRAAGELTEDKIGRKFPGQPLVQGEILLTVGDSYRAVGEYDPAIEHLRRSRQVLARALGPDHPSTLSSQSSLAGAYQDAGKLSEAIPLFEKIFRVRKDRLGSDDPLTLQSHNNLALIYLDAGRRDEAISLLEELLEIQKAEQDPDPVVILITQNNLGGAYWDAGRLKEAIPLWEETLRARKALLGPDHPDTLQSQNNLAMAYFDAGRLKEAIPLCEQTLRAREAKLGDGHPLTLSSRNNLAGAYLAAGRPKEAIPLFERTLRAQKDKLGADHSRTLMCQNNLAGAYWRVGRRDEALSLLEQTLQAQKAKLGPDHPDTLTTRGNLIQAYEEVERFDKLEPLLRERLAFVLEAEPPDSPEVAGVRAHLGICLLRQKKYAEAEAVLRACLAVREEKEPDTWFTSNTRSMLGEALSGQKEYAEAEKLLLAGHAGLTEHAAEIPGEYRAPRLAESAQRLVDLYTAWNKQDQAKEWQARLAEIQKAKPEPRK